MSPFVSWVAHYSLQIIEGFIVLVSFIYLLARVKPDKSLRCFHPLGRWFTDLSKSKTRAVVLVGLTVLCVRVALIPVLGIPQPGGQDEFSYLLAGDTFAHGRLANPTHPMWIHFETFHVNQKPTYSSMYPPGQGLLLAGGEILGHPWIGELVATALVCSAICWALQGWLPPMWALFGALLAVLRIGILGFWMNGYWASSLSGLGGALVLGAWPRLRKTLQLRYAVCLGLGLVILANVRPYEGFVFSLPFAFAMLLWLVGKRRPAFPLVLTRVVFPLFLILALAAFGMGYYYWRVTGSPFQFAYHTNRSTYAQAQYFLWQRPAPTPVYHHEIMRIYYEYELYYFNLIRTPWGYLVLNKLKALLSWRFYIGPALTLPLFALPWVFRDRRMRFPLIIAIVFLAGLAIETWGFPHYLAPAVALLYLIVAQCMRHLRLWNWRGKTLGVAWLRAIPMICITMMVLRIVAAAEHQQIEYVWPPANHYRAEILGKLDHLDGQHLVLVRYLRNHNGDVEWVYNGADIDSAKVVWARDMGDAANRELLRYYKNRDVWMVDADDSPPRLSVYSPALGPSNPGEMNTTVRSSPHSSPGIR